MRLPRLCLLLLFLCACGESASPSFGSDHRGLSAIDPTSLGSPGGVKFNGTTAERQSRKGGISGWDAGVLAV
ncbi:MAG: hypothetical protein ACJ790_08200, partial [Myxococcaceae bacterium]